MFTKLYNVLLTFKSVSETLRKKGSELYFSVKLFLPYLSGKTNFGNFLNIDSFKSERIQHKP